MPKDPDVPDGFVPGKDDSDSPTTTQVATAMEFLATHPIDFDKMKIDDVLSWAQWLRERPHLWGDPEE